MPHTVLRGDITQIKFYLPKDKLNTKFSESFYPSDEFYAMKLWDESKRTVKKWDPTASEKIVLPFDLDNYLGCSLDPGTLSCGIRLEYMEGGQSNGVIVSEAWKNYEDEYKYANYFNTLNDLDLTGVDLCVVEKQINPDMFFVEHITIGIMTSKGVTCAVVEPKLKSYIFRLPTGEALKPASEKKTLEILAAEKDQYTLDQVAHVNKFKTASDLTDPVLQLRAAHVQMVNYCLRINI